MTAPFSLESVTVHKHEMIRFWRHKRKAPGHGVWRGNPTVLRYLTECRQVEEFEKKFLEPGQSRCSIAAYNTTSPGNLEYLSCREGEISVFFGWYTNLDRLAPKLPASIAASEPKTVIRFIDIKADSTRLLVNSISLNSTVT